jgi:hypothetical protein
MAVFGLLPARELAELAIDTLGFQHYWKTARLYLAARWWLIGAGKPLRIGGKIVAEAARCRNVRPMLGNVAPSAAIEAAGPPPSPTSSRARLEALIAETRRDAGIVIHGARAQSTAQLIVTQDRRSFLGIVLRNAGSMELRVRLRTDKISQGRGPYSTWHPQGARIGWGEGRFTALLAERVEELVAVDISETALRRARDRCRGCANVRFERLVFSTDPLPNALDLIVCSEVLYYLKDKARALEDLRQTGERTRA